MFSGEFKDVVMKLAEDGVWVFLAFIGVQIGVVIASAFVRRRQFCKSQAETASECQAIHAFLDVLCGNLSNDDGPSESEPNGPERGAERVALLNATTRQQHKGPKDEH